MESVPFAHSSKEDILLNLCDVQQRCLFHLLPPLAIAPTVPPALVSQTCQTSPVCHETKYPSLSVPMAAYAPSRSVAVSACLSCSPDTSHMASLSGPTCVMLVLFPCRMQTWDCPSRLVVTVVITCK